MAASENTRGGVPSKDASAVSSALRSTRERLGRNLNRYAGEEIDIPSVLSEASQSAEGHGWQAERMTLDEGPDLLAFHRAADPASRRIYLSAGIHGDEPAGPMALLHLLRENQWPVGAEYWVLPCLNPTGFSLNRRENADGQDLNRDYRQPRTPEVRAHVAWLDRQPAFDLALLLHEDWESQGFYVYELNRDGQPSLAEPMVAAVSAVCPIDRSAMIEGRPAQDGIIRPNLDPNSRPDWPEAFYLFQHKAPLSYTLEAPSDFHLSVRVAALVSAIQAALRQCVDIGFRSNEITTMKTPKHSARWATWMMLGWGILASTGWAAPKADKSQARADLSDAFFKSADVPHFFIEITGTNLAALQQDNRRYVQATVQVGPNTFSEVGIHLKGAAGSFRGLDDKPALTLNFDKFRSGQRFHGLDKLHLNNSVQDPTYITEILCGEMFLGAGVPTARGTHARVTVNRRDHGFYVLKEGFDKAFLKRHFKNAGGNLYDGGFLREITEPLERNSGEGPEDRAELKALAQAAEEHDPNQRLARLGKLLDVDRFLSFIVIEVMTCHWDGYALKRNNYRLYQDPDSSRIVFFPHGMDQMFTEANFPVLPGFDGLIARALVSSPEGRQRYLVRATNLFDRAFQYEVLTNRVRQIQARIRPVLATMNADAARQHDDAVNHLCDRIVSRAESLARQLGQPGPGDLKFDAAGQAPLAHWNANPDGAAVLDQASVDGKGAVHVRATGPGAASWRTTVKLPPGRYAFSGSVRTSGVAAVRDSKGEGAGLRASGAGAARSNRATGNTPWTVLEHEFEVRPGTAQVVLVCELRGTAGEAWFELASLKVRRR